MDESVRKGNQAEAFEHYRVLLFSIAYRMTGSASDAEDLVQETYLRYQASQSEEIVSLKAYLTTILTHLALNYLKSARVVREQYLGIWLPEPILFLSASQVGDMAALTHLLAQDAVSWSDGGGKIRVPLRPIRGRSAVARYWAGMARKDRHLLELRMEEVNGQLAVVAWEGAALFAVIALMATQEGVQEMYAILNPEKLVYIQRQIEARQRTPQV